MALCADAYKHLPTIDLNEQVADPHWLSQADAAIALVLEEAAKLVEAYDGPGMESVPDAPWGDAQATKDDIAYYIRALGEKA
jgi:hypothetical protein